VHLSGAIFGEPAWDLLLEVYVREASGLSATAADLQAELAQPSSTAVRWLKVLEEQGLIRRKQLSTGVEVIGLTSDGRAALNDYLTAVQKL
jgi:DNA-binding MarR family transcriptional regulator